MGYFQIKAKMCLKKNLVCNTKIQVEILAQLIGLLKISQIKEKKRSKFLLFCAPPILFYFSSLVTSQLHVQLAL